MAHRENDGLATTLGSDPEDYARDVALLNGARVLTGVVL